MTKCRIITSRPKNHGPIKSLDTYARETLQMCADRWDAASRLDTAVRDNVAQGLAYLVWSAYDSISCSKAIGFAEDDYNAAGSFTDSSTAQWFRERGFAEWFCIAAGNLFHNQRPRIKSENMPFRIHRTKKRKVSA